MISLPPSSSPYPDTGFILPKDLVDDLRLKGTILTGLMTIFLLFVLFFLGRVRRSVRGRYYVIMYATKISYLLVPISITYLMGVLHKDSKPHVLSPVWAAILIYAYGGVVTITACDLRDNDETLGYVLRTLPLLFWTAWLGLLVFDVIEYHSMVALVCTMFCFLGLAVINTKQTLEAFYKASKSKGLPHEVEPLVQYMHEQSNTMSIFKCLVWGNDENGTTIEQIWKWVTPDKEQVDEGEWDPALLAKKRGFLANCGGKDRLRDICLSYALFRMLLIRFAGFYDSNPIHLKQLIEEGILHSEEPQRVFRITEVELGFLFDYFYTKSHVCGSYRFRDVWQKLAQVLLIGCVGAFALPIIAEDHLKYDFDHKVRLLVVLTCSILIKIVLLESCKYIMVHFSNRKLVWLLCTGIRQTVSSNKWARTTQKRIVWIWTIKSYFSSKFDVPFLFFFSPWQRKLGQYSFLSSYGRVPILAHKPFSSLSRVMKLPRIGQQGDYRIPLSNQVEQAVISSLKRNPQPKFYRGEDTTFKLPNGCESDSNIVTFILVWHIATSFYESLHPIENPNDRGHENFLVANQLSKYCAYLMAFIPEIHIDRHVYIMEREFDRAVRQAIDLKMPRLNVREGYEQLITRSEGVNKENIVAMGAMLAHQLSSKCTIGNANRGWRVLAEFWTELLLHLAVSNNAEVHLKYLSRGGEFITHLWVLLAHVGVHTTNSSSTQSFLDKLAQKDLDCFGSLFGLKQDPKQMV